MFGIVNKHLLMGAAIAVAAAAFGHSTVGPQTGLGGGTICYNRSGQKVSCSRPAPRPPVYTPPPTTTNNNNAQAEADRRAAEEAQRRREEAARAEAERQRLERERIERERQEKFDRDKQDALNSLKGTTSASPEIKGASSTEPKLKDGSSDYNRVRTETAVTSVRGWDGRGALDASKFNSEDFITALPWTSEKFWSKAKNQRVRLFARNAPLPGWEYEFAPISNTWDAILAVDANGNPLRGPTGFAAPAARSGKMLERQDFGTQSTNSCALHALATSLGVPLTEVWSRAQSMFAAAYGPSGDERKDLDTALKTGMYSVEFAALAESFGTTKLVPPTQFAATIKAGKPILAYLAVPHTSKTMGHQVVLDRTFQMNGETWFEMVDSNQSGQWDRRFIRQSELSVVLKEQGLTVQPTPKTVTRQRRRGNQ